MRGEYVVKQEAIRDTFHCTLICVLQILDLMIELFNKGEESLLDIPSADLPKIPTIPVYVRTRTSTAQCGINNIICVYAVTVILRPNYS